MLQFPSLQRLASRRVLPVALLSAALMMLPSVAVAQLPKGAPKIDNPFPKMPETFGERFELRDSRALDMLQYIYCMNTTVAAGKQGVLGAVPDSALLVCVREGGEWRGVAGILSRDRLTFNVVSQLALRTVGAGVRTTDKVDTAKAAAVARAQLRGATTPVRGAPKYSFTTVPLALPTFMELWFMPVQNSATAMIVGGDSLIQMTMDGRREQGHVKQAPPVRELPMPSGKSFVFESTEDELPLVSELLAARLALMRVPEVRIRTKKYESVISNTTRKWAHTARRG